MARLIKTDGSEKEISPKNGTDFSLEELQKYVDGYIEIIPMDDGNILVVNEEGKYDCEENEKATEIANENGALFFGDYIAGDVVLCKDGEVQ